MGEIAQSNIGLTYKPSDIEHSGIPVLRSNNIHERKIILDDLVRVNCQILPKQFVLNGDLLICARNGSRRLVGKCALIKGLNEPMSFGAFMAICRSDFNVWIETILNSAYFAEYLDESNSTTIHQVTQQMLLDFPLPFPPLNEQERIVGEIKEIFDIIDEIEKSKIELFEIITQAKSKILSLAIQGKLVEQDINDEPAEVLLTRVNPAWEPCDTSQYENLSNGWILSPLKDCTFVVMGQSPESNSYNIENGVEFHQGKLLFTKYLIGYSKILTDAPKKLAKPDSLILSVRAPVGAVNITDREIAIGRGLCSIKPRRILDLRYLYYWFLSYQSTLESKSTGTTFKAVSVDIVKNEIIPIPPFEEQKRIVKQIKSMFQWLDEIESSLQ